MILFQQEKLHLNADLSVDILADRLGISTRKLAVVLKTGGETTYVKLVNQFRVAEASRLLEDPESTPFKMDVIATMSGFTNRQHFRKVFEQVTGVNPGYYREVRKPQPGADRSESNEI
jgi:transcriptional regulator GlxA family with amidase domain